MNKCTKLCVNLRTKTYTVMTLSKSNLAENYNPNKNTISVKMKPSLATVLAPKSSEI